MATPEKRTVIVNGIPYSSVKGTAPKPVFVNGKSYSQDAAQIINDQNKKNTSFEKGLKSASNIGSSVMGDPSNKGGRRRRRNRSTKRRNISRRRKMTKRRK